MKYVFSMTLALTLLATAPALAEDTIDVMTQNQYLGADLTPIITAPNPAAFNEALIAALEQIAANDYRSRAKSLAKLIANRLPELVGLQEMFAFTCTDAPGTPPGQGCNKQSIRGAFNDHLDSTLFELAELGEVYTVGAVIENLNITLPVDLNADANPDIFVNVLDRDVILARDDVEANPVPFSAICGNIELPGLGSVGVPGANGSPGCNFANIAEVPTALTDENGDPIVVKVQRGFVGVDAIIDGKVYRFVDTHLEVQNLIPAPPTTPPNVIPGGSIQALQATELNVLVTASLGLPPGPPDHLIIVGDINSGPMDQIFVDPAFPIPGALLSPPYMQLANGVDLLGNPTPLGFTDAWTVPPSPPLGFTCCQLDDLSNFFSILDERIDVIFSLVPPSSVTRARVLGARIWDKTFPPRFGQRLWPSDHGSVAAELGFQ